MAAVVEDYFQEHVGFDVNFKNVAVGGATSRDWSPTEFNAEGDGHWMSREEPLFDRIPATDIVVILLAANDTQGAYESKGGIVYPAEYRRHMSTIVDTLTGRGVKHVVLVGSATPAPWFCGNIYNPNYDAVKRGAGCRIGEYRNVLEDYVDSRNYWQDRGAGGFEGRVSYVNTHETRQFQSQNGYWDTTGDIHPTINGHYFFGNAIARHLYEDVLELGVATDATRSEYVTADWEG